MDDQRQGVDMGFTKERFPGGTHICLIFDDAEQRRKIVSKFLAAGIRGGDQVRYVVDVTTPEQVRSWLLELAEYANMTPVCLMALHYSKYSKSIRT